MTDRHVCTVRRRERSYPTYDVGRCAATCRLDARSSFANFPIVHFPPQPTPSLSGRLSGSAGYEQCVAAMLMVMSSLLVGRARVALFGRYLCNRRQPCSVFRSQLCTYTFHCIQRSVSQHTLKRRPEPCFGALDRLLARGGEFAIKVGGQPFRYRLNPVGRPIRDRAARRLAPSATSV